jgi:hypothetical protein
MADAGLPGLDVARVRRWCEEQVPPDMRDRMRVEVDVAPRHLTIQECHPLWPGAAGPEWTRTTVARIRYTKSKGTWSLYWQDSNLRFREYDGLAPTPRIDDVLAEIDRDPTFLFWG